jgi:hypothetical protein
MSRAAPRIDSRRGPSSGDTEPRGDSFQKNARRSHMRRNDHVLFAISTRRMVFGDESPKAQFAMNTALQSEFANSGVARCGRIERMAR